MLSPLATLAVPPLVAPLTMEVVSASPSGSVSFTCTSIKALAVSSFKVTKSVTASGASLTGITVMNTVSVSQSTGDPLSQIL